MNLLVENKVLCELYPYKQNSCDEMDSVRLQARRMREMENYIDAQAGGPGKGFYRIVTDPFQARRVINEGKLAVIMGIEVSEPFGCQVLQRASPSATAPTSTASWTRPTGSACARWRSSTSSTTRWPAWRATAARTGRRSSTTATS